MHEINNINKNKLDFFHKKGFLILKNVLSKKVLELIKKRLKFLTKKQKDGRGLSEPGIKNP